MKNINTKIVFILTNLAFQALVGQFGVYSIIKQPMATLYGYDQQYLGMLEAIQIIGETIGSLILLFININPLRGFLIFAVLNGIFSLIMCAPRYISIIIVRDFIVIICLFFQTFFLSALAFTQIIFNTQKCQSSVWYSLTLMGDICALILTQYAVQNLGIKWQYAKIIWNAYIIIIGLLMFFLLEYDTDEKQIEQIYNEQQYRESQIDPANMQNVSDFKICLMFAKKMCKIFKQANIFLVVVSFGLVQGLYVNLLSWVPYYYIAIGQISFSMIAILAPCLAMVLGGLIIELVFFQILKLQKYNKPISYFFFIIATASYILLWFNRNQQPKTQIILLFIANFCISCPYSRISSAQPLQQTNYNHSKVQSVFLMAHLSRNVFVAIFTLSIGFFMKLNSKSFWNIILINVILAFVVETIRKLFLKSNQNQENNIEPIQHAESQ